MFAQVQAFVPAHILMFQGHRIVQVKVSSRQVYMGGQDFLDSSVITVELELSRASVYVGQSCYVEQTYLVRCHSFQPQTYCIGSRWPQTLLLRSG
jgi:hypothetical protein